MAEQWVRITKPGEEHSLAVAPETFERDYKPHGWIALHYEDFTPYEPPARAAKKTEG